MKTSGRPELASATQSGRTGEGPREVALVLPCYNEALNVEVLYDRLCAVMESLPRYRFRLYFIDNASTDDTAEKLRALALRDPRVCVILNARNFGHIRSPFHGMLEAEGHCVITLAADLQDPPELIVDFLALWESGNSCVLGKKTSSDESLAMYLVRGFYYRFIHRISDVPLLDHITGFGLYDRRIIEILRSFRDPYPYVRGMITDIGLPYAVVPYHQERRKRGLSKNNFMTLFDLAMLAVTSYSRLPLRLAVLAGFALSALSLLVALVYLVLKLLFWDQLPAGYAPAVIGIFFLGSVQLFLLGLLGEYIGAVLTQVRHRPLIVERERIGGAPLL